MSDERPHIDLSAIRSAARRIARHVRRTPLVPGQPVKAPVAAEGWSGRLSLKLECHQITGSFKARGAVHKLLTLEPAQVARGLVTASGGNHGLGVAYAGWLSATPASIFLPRNTPAAKAAKLEQWGARVVFHGDVWDDANAAAVEAAARDGLTYVHPFADPAIIAGQGTAALEVLEDAPDVDVLVVAIGGGGLISGTALAAKGLRPGARVIGVEPVGAATLTRSLEAGELVTLDAIETRATTLAPRRSERLTFDLIRELVDEIVLVDDEAMRAAARWLWFEHGVAAELSGAAAVAALQTGQVALHGDEHVCALVCGAGQDGLPD